MVILPSISITWEYINLTGEEPGSNKLFGHIT